MQKATFSSEKNVCKIQIWRFFYSVPYQYTDRLQTKQPKQFPIWQPNQATNPYRTPSVPIKPVPLVGRHTLLENLVDEAIA